MIGFYILKICTRLLIDCAHRGAVVANKKKTILTRKS